MDLNLLKTFMKVADCESLTKASKVLGSPKSKISRDLVKLEHEMEQTLLKRSPKGIVLTEQGFKLLQMTRASLESLESSVQSLKSKTDEMRGVIKITAPEDLSAFILTRLVSEFMEMYPEIKVELYSTSEFLDFKRHDIDLALRIGRLKDSSLIQKKITDINVIFVASTKYAKSTQQITTLKQLESHPVAVIKDIDGNPLNKSQFNKLSVSFSSNSMSVLKDFVLRDNGIATIPSFLCKSELQTKEFTRILPDQVHLNRSLYILSRPSTYTPKHVKVFKDFLTEKLKKEI